jgi:hypothetical protein
MLVLRTIFFCIVSLVSLYSYSIETSLDTNGLIEGINVTYSINIQALESENYSFSFPKDQSFRDFTLIGSRLESGRTLSSNGILQELRYVYTLLPVTNGNARIPTIAVEITSKEDPSDSGFYKTPALSVYIKPRAKRLLWVKVAILLIILSGLVFGCWKLYTKAAIRIRAGREDEFKKIAERYKDIILREDTLKFKQDKKEYLIFLIRQFKSFYHEMSGKPFQNQIKSLYNEVTQFEDSLKFKKDINTDKVNRLVREIESNLLGIV